MKVLNTRQSEVLKLVRIHLHDLGLILAKFNAYPKDQNILSESIKKIDDLFLLVVVGEFNSGKSAFINALLGEKLLEEGVTPTTTNLNILRYGKTQERVINSENELIIYLPINWLAEISIVDTPGTNAIIRDHEKITAQFVPQSDLVLFITSTDRPFTESERVFLESIQDWGKKVVVIINKIDILDNEMDLESIMVFVRDNSHKLLGITPEIFPVSSKNALAGKLGDQEKWDSSNFKLIEDYIYTTLDEDERIKLKFLNPLGVGLRLGENYLNIVSDKLASLNADLEMISDVESQLRIYEVDMKRNFDYRMADLDNVLLEMEQRGDDFFEDTFRIARVFDLLNKDRIQHEFESEVVAQVPNLIDTKVNELINWLVDSDLRQWQAVNQHLIERRKSYQERIVGDDGFGNISYERDRLIDTISKETQRIISSYDKDQVAKSIAEDAQLAVAASAALEIGAIGLGTLVAVLATSAAADITGILLASLVAVLGFIVIPTRRRMAKKELHDKVSVLRNQLIGTLQNQFLKEIEKSIQKINEAIAPYTRFVRAEQGRLLDIQSEIDRIRSEFEKLKTEIENM
jgi:small GTP-binding protein